MGTQVDTSFTRISEELGRVESYIQELEALRVRLETANDLASDQRATIAELRTKNEELQAAMDTMQRIISASGADNVRKD